MLLEQYDALAQIVEPLEAEVAGVKAAEVVAAFVVELVVDLVVDDVDLRVLVVEAFVLDVVVLFGQ